jgi:hypothetical protein
MLFQFECQIHYAVRGILEIRNRNLRYLDVRPTTQKAFVDEVTARMERTVWKSGCKSWYLNEDGSCPTLWPGFTFEYWLRTRRVRSADFEFQYFDRAPSTVAAPNGSAWWPNDDHAGQLRSSSSGARRGAP